MSLSDMDILVPSTERAIKSAKITYSLHEVCYDSSQNEILRSQVHHTEEQHFEKEQSGGMTVAKYTAERVPWI